MFLFFMMLLIWYLETNSSLFGIVFLDIVSALELVLLLIFFVVLLIWHYWTFFHDALVTSDVAIKVVGNDLSHPSVDIEFSSFHLVRFCHSFTRCELESWTFLLIFPLNYPLESNLGLNILSQNTISFLYFWNKICA